VGTESCIERTERTMTSSHSSFSVGAAPGISALVADRFTAYGPGAASKASGHRVFSSNGHIGLEKVSGGGARGLLQTLQNTLFPGFFRLSMGRHQPARRAATGDVPSKATLNRALQLGRSGVGDTGLSLSASLEEAFSDLLHEVSTGLSVKLGIVVEGKPQKLRPAIHQQLFLIGKEAVMNALHHSKATMIEVEVRYLSRSLRVLVHDNGCGIKPDVVQKPSYSYRGLRGMRDRAETIGARFEIWSRPGAGTEVRTAVPFTLAIAKDSAGKLS
jgi:hypothetical protein